jgi:hypothetical protein
VVFKLPYQTVLDMWRRCISAAYAPEAVYGRFAYNITHTFARRKKFPVNPQRASWTNVRMGVGILARLIWRIGVRGDYRRTFWRLAWPALKAGEIEPLIHAAIVSHHLIAFTRDCLGGLGESSFYAAGDGGGPDGVVPTPDRPGTAVPLLAVAAVPDTRAAARRRN